MQSRSTRKETPGPLTDHSRLPADVRRAEVITIAGVVREIDLDGERFEARGIEARFVTDVRCNYGPKVADRVASKCLNHRVEVRGRVERDAGDRARLMKVASLKFVNAPYNAQQQIEFQFPDENS